MQPPLSPGLSWAPVDSALLASFLFPSQHGFFFCPNPKEDLPWALCTWIRCAEEQRAPVCRTAFSLSCYGDREGESCLSDAQEGVTDALPSQPLSFQAVTCQSGGTPSFSLGRGPLAPTLFLLDLPWISLFCVSCIQGTGFSLFCLIISRTSVQCAAFLQRKGSVPTPLEGREKVNSCLSSDIRGAPTQRSF